MSLNLFSQSAVIIGESYIGKPPIYVSIFDEIGSNYMFELSTFDIKEIKDYSRILPITNPQMIYVVGFENNKPIPYKTIIFPNDTLIIKEKENGFEYLGSNRNENMFLYNLEKKGYGLFYGSEMDCKMCLEEHILLRKKQLNLLEKESTDGGFRREYLSIVKDMFNLQYIWGWLKLYNYKFHYSKNEFILNESFLDSLKSFKKYLLLDTTNIKNCYYSSYATTLRTYNRFLAQPDFSQEPTFDEELNSAVKNFDGFYRDLLLTLIIKNGFENNNVTYRHIYDFFELCRTSKYRNYIDIKWKEMRESTNNILNFDFNLLIDRFEKITKKSSYTYIDFWASWCAPCRAEMPNSKKLKEEYKNINFIYISTDENHSSWEKAMKQIGLSETESYLLPKGNDSEIIKKFKITSIPRYMIINKDGKVINQDAPRPSDPKIREIFDELLRK